MSIARLFVLLLVGLLPLAAKEYRAQRFDVNLRLQDGGSVLVTEAIVFQFGEGPFQFVFRDLPPGHHDGISGIAALMDGQELPEGNAAGQAEIKGLRVTWHFAPLENSVHTFTLSYLVHGAASKAGGADVFAWPAIPRDRSYVIDGSSVVLEYPAGAALQDQPELTGARAAVESSPGRMRMEIRDGFAADHGLTLKAAFAPGTLTAKAPAWQVREQEHERAVKQAFPIGGAVLVLALAAGGFLLFRLRGLVRPYGRTESGAAAPVMGPPDEIPPAIAGFLASGENASALALAVLFDLARRGAIRIEQTGKTRSPEFIVHRGVLPGHPAPHEQTVLALLFGKDAARESCTMSDFGKAFGSESTAFVKRLREETEAIGLIDPGRARVRGRMLGVAVGMATAGIVAIVIGVSVGAGLEAAAAALAGFGAGLLLAAVGGGLLRRSLSPLTIAGETAARQWRGFASHVKNIAKGRTTAVGPDAFGPWLAYAAAFGLAASWTKHFRRQNLAEVPAWFDGGLTGLDAFIASGSASGSDSSGGSGAGGAGGGSSGAG